MLGILWAPGACRCRYIMCALTRLTWQIALEGEAEAGTGRIHVRVALTQTWVAAGVFMYCACLCTLQGRGSTAALLSQCRKDASVLFFFAFRFGADCWILLTALAGSLKKMYIKNKLLRYSGPSSGNASPEEIGIAESERSLKSPLKNKLSAHLLYLFTPQNLPRQPRDADGSGDKLK